MGLDTLATAGEVPRLAGAKTAGVFTGAAALTGAATETAFGVAIFAGAALAGPDLGAMVLDVLDLMALLDFIIVNVMFI